MHVVPMPRKGKGTGIITPWECTKETLPFHDGHMDPCVQQTD